MKSDKLALIPISFVIVISTGLAFFMGIKAGRKKASKAATEAVATRDNADSLKKAAETAHVPMDSSGMMAAKYYCPMDKDVHSDKLGKCPKCGMELVEVGKDSKGMKK